MPGTAAQRFEAGNLGPAVLDLYLARIVAAWKRRDVAALNRLRPDVRALLDAGMRLQLAMALITGFGNYLRDRPEPAERGFEWANRMIRRSVTPHGQADLLALVVPTRIDNLRRTGASDEAITVLFNEWIAARRSSTEPLIALAEYQLDTGKDSAAMATIRSARKLSPKDEAILALRVRAARQLYANSDQDGAGLLAQCQQRTTLVPEVPDPVCYLLCGEAALAAGVPEVALACGRAAVDAMPWSQSGRLLEARAELLAARPQAAALVMQKLVDVKSPDREALAVALEAHRAAEWPATDLLWIALRSTPPSFELSTDLLRLLQQDDPRAPLPLAHALLRRSDLPVPLTALLAATFARAGDRQIAQRLLDRLRPGDPELQPVLDEVRQDLATAVGDLLRLAAAAGADDSTLSEQAAHWTVDYELDTAAAAPAMLALGDDLATTHPGTAYTLITSALAAAAPEHRCGAKYAQAGNLALRLGRLALAETHWTAALAFPDGRAAAEPLARLCFATNRAERALQVYGLATDVTDPALALRCGNLKAVERLTADSLERDAGDLLTHVTITVVGLPSLTSDLSTETAAEREALLELASILRSEELATYGLVRAQALLAEKPGASAKLLAARANAMAATTSSPPGTASTASRTLAARRCCSPELPLPQPSTAAAPT